MNEAKDSALGSIEAKKEAVHTELDGYVEAHHDALKGDKGDGYTPVKGVDYYTESDKTEMVNAVISALPKYEGGVS